MTDDYSEDSVNQEGLFAGYEIESAFYDEMFDAAGSPRPHCSRLWEALNGIPPSELATMQERAERSFLHEGITFSVYGEEGAHERIRENPANFISQPTLDLSRAPCLTADGAAPRHVDLRPFVLRGRETRMVPGAFCRVALTLGSLVVNSSQGGGGKDLWVLSE